MATNPPIIMVLVLMIANTDKSLDDFTNTKIKGKESNLKIT
jgi:hypothetical protein